LEVVFTDYLFLITAKQSPLPKHIKLQNVTMTLVSNE